MAVFTCICLNIRVHARGDIPKLKDVSFLHLTENTAVDPFFAPNVSVATLDLGGVTKSQKSLCKERFVDGWTIVTCTCCAFEMYAQYSDDYNRVLVNSSAEKQNSEAVRQLMETSRYSRLFKLVLPEINDNFIQNNIGIELRNTNLDTSIEQVQNQVSIYLRDEQKAMEERIRKFTEAQQSNYADLLQRVRKHKQAMVYLLLKSKEGQTSNQNEAVGDSPLTSPATALNKETGGSNESSTSTDSAFDRSETSAHSNDKTRKQNPRYLRRTMSNPARSTKPKKGPRRPPVNIDVGGVFDMEEFDSKEEFSDIDSEGSESSNIDDSVPEKPKDRMLCATSLPMSIPTFSHYPRFTAIGDCADDYEEPLPKNPEEIAASMRALACSVRDGTEMFGELPRRRLNTGELLSSRPL